MAYLETLQIFFEQSATTFILFAGILGAIFGSFLNVIIYRLPAALLEQWKQDCTNFLNLPPSPLNIPLPQTTSWGYQLCFPRSHCPMCKYPLKFYDNIPVLSFLLLKGRCRSCHQAIGYQYLIVELLAIMGTVIITYRHGFSLSTLWFSLFTYLLIVQSWIDINHQIIPDELTLPALWAGILINLTFEYVPLQDSILGAIIGYLSLWLLYQLFRLCTQKEGIGYGDFKFTAMLGAWVGWQMLPCILVISGILGTCIGLCCIARKPHYHRNTPIPFGPFLAIAGWITLLWGPLITQWYWQSIAKVF